MRPHTLDDMVGQRPLGGPGAPLRALIEADRLSSIILWGPPGTGKTTLARVVATQTNRQFMSLSAVTAGVKDVREVIESARQSLVDSGQGTILFLDEVHRFNKSQQDALLPAVEAGIITLIGATTENPFFEVNAPLISRSTIFRLESLSNDDLTVLVHRALDLEKASADDDAVAHLVDMAGGDGRAALTTPDIALALAQHDQVGTGPGRQRRQESPGRPGAAAAAQRASLPGQQDERGRRLLLPAQPALRLRPPGVPAARDRRRRDRLAGAAALLPAVAPRRRGRHPRTAAG